MRIDRRSTAAWALAASVTLFAASGARAECPAGTPCDPSPDAGTPSAPALTPERIALFARMVKATESAVMRRLEADPELPALALAATDAHVSRKSTGKTLTFLGGGILVVGDLVGALMMASAPGYPDVSGAGQAQFTAGLGVAVASIGLGLALGIPGVIQLVKKSPEEKLAVRHYRQLPPAPHAQDQAMPPPGAAGAPLLSFTF